MRFHLLLSNVTGAVAGPDPAAALVEAARRAEEAGLDRVWLPDHQWWDAGPADRPVLDPFAVLGLLAGATRRIGLGPLVAGVHFRHPAVLLKQVTTLDVLSGGRACFGIGAGWYRPECAGLGIPFPPAPQRYALLADALRLARLMWSPEGASADTAPALTGEVLVVPRALCSPAPRRVPPVLVGGDGPKWTLPLVAAHADEANLFATTEDGTSRLDVLADRVRRLAAECAAVDRDPAGITLTATVLTDPSAGRAALDRTRRLVDGLAALGVAAVVIGDPAAVGAGVLDRRAVLDTWLERVVPQAPEPAPTWRGNR
ncbi:LLM class flavin-dependent oxidoreductase [Saccharothrix obliqua]|uniref:LLM class flavin-dependent oxidoreductase n=1 Tax=Saccharothrix obliqua TaxID=2861747 RepID=UPI001C5EF7C7|nr:LLM class flavin-dependent oxidoreductase [Saccharothrix obliqua]MBW4720414.1 LLM class flavin-dependent oxidoreductase [Saccharothrix obliqua]